MQPATNHPRSQTTASAREGAARRSKRLRNGATNQRPAASPVRSASAHERANAHEQASAHERVRVRLCIYFAIATCLSGLTLTGNQATEMLPVIACFFALFGLVFVDLLKWFSLPPPIAYVALGAIALYSIGRFNENGLAIGDDQQMEIVAELLVLVQAVLMLQRKNRRIFEQLSIFCLLELVVAAIFNNALTYGLLLLPLGMVGAGALTLLQTYHTSEEAFVTSESTAAATASGSHGVRTWTTGSAESFSRAGLVLPRVTFTVLTPAVLLVALFFFYGLPRTNLAANSASGGRMLVGFNETVQLAQFGQMLQSDAPAARIELIDRGSQKPYYSTHGLYLRGAVLESYNPDGREPGTWSSSEVKNRYGSQALPSQPMFGELDELVGQQADAVLARVTVEPSRSSALFALAPYYQLGTPRAVIHQRDRWLLSRRRTFGQMSSGRLTYQFATNGFSGGRQTRFLPRHPRPTGPDSTPARAAVAEAAGGQQSQLELADALSYDQICLEYDEYIVPSAQLLAEAVLAETPRTSESPLEIGAAIEKFFSAGGEFQYTLNLSGEHLPGIDPIEQFLAIGRQGNCQHFASAMALMLRSQGIPARLVVGYHTDEFNSIGGFYTARQLHAHAWVEALVDAQWIDPEELYHPLDWSDQYWVQFDPTPGGGGVDRALGGRVAEVLDLAQSMWTDYVVQRNPPGRRRDGLADDGVGGITSQYQLVILWLEHKLSVIRAGELGGGALSLGERFSWTAAIFGGTLALMVILAFRLRRPQRWSWRPMSRRQAELPATPQVAFFAETLRLLQRAGIRRLPQQTPLELTNQAAMALDQAGTPSLDRPLRLLTQAFYHTRFGGGADSAACSRPDDADVAAALQRVRQRVEQLGPRVKGRGT